MRLPTSDDFPELRGKSAAFYAAWLVRGLTGYLFLKNGRYAFTYAATFIKQQESIGMDLAEIAQTFDEGDLNEFRAACVNAFDALLLPVMTEDEFARMDVPMKALVEENFALGEEILRLCAILSASDVLDVLRQKNMGVKRPDLAENIRSLHYLSFEVVRDLTEPASATFETVAGIIVESCNGGVARDQISPTSHAINDLNIDSLDFLDIAFAIDKAFGIKMPLEQWTQDVNEGKVASDEFFLVGNLCRHIDALVAAKRI